VRSAEGGAKPALRLHLLQELDHAVPAPDVLAVLLAIVDAGDAVQIQPAVEAKAFARRVEESLEVGHAALAVPGHVESLRSDDHLGVGFAERFGNDVLGAAVVRRGVDDVDAERKAFQERVDRVSLRHQPELTGAGADRRDAKLRSAQSSIFHQGAFGRLSRFANNRYAPGTPAGS
jgi:hypothetical protein